MGLEMILYSYYFIFEEIVSNVAKTVVYEIETNLNSRINQNTFSREKQKEIKTAGSSSCKKNLKKKKNHSPLLQS